MTQPANALRTPNSALLAVAALLLAGAAVRVAYLDVPPTEFHATRQYRSALIARAASDAALAPLSPVERGNAIAMAQAQATIEPELMEPVAAALYDLAGSEDLRLPRAVAIIGWLLAAFSTWWLVALSTPHSRLRTAHLALLGVLFIPYTVEASRAFMPDPWMTGLTMLTLALTLRHTLSPSVAGFLARSVVAAAAIYVKPMAVFFIAPAFLAVDVARVGLVSGLVSAAASLAIAAAPAAWHYMTLINSGNPVAQDRFFIELWSRSTYWSGWGVMISRVTSYLWIPALVGLIVGRGPLRLLLAATWFGYIVMGLMFTHHISTHDYYSLPIIPIVAASVALLARAWPLVPAVVIAAALLLTTTPRALWGDVDRARQAAADYERIGERTGHSPRVVSLDGSYGYPLAYHARITTSQLTLSIDRAVSELAGRSNAPLLDDIRSRGGHFFVGTLQPELDADPFARAWLDQRTTLVDRAGTVSAWRYVVYDLVTPPSLRTAHNALRTTNEAAVSADAAVPIGYVDAPPAGVEITVADTAIVIQGWALDDKVLVGVEVVARSADGTERTIGQATRDGRRPDIAAAYPSFPGLDQSVWTFMLLPEDKSLGAVTLLFRGVDSAGNTALLGERTLRTQ